MSMGSSGKVVDKGEVSVDVESFATPSLLIVTYPPTRGDADILPLELGPNSMLAAVLLSTSPSYVGESMPSSDSDMTPERLFCRREMLLPPVRPLPLRPAPTATPRPTDAPVLVVPEPEPDASAGEREGPEDVCPSGEGEDGICEFRDAGMEMVDAPSSVNGSLSSSDLGGCSKSINEIRNIK